MFLPHEKICLFWFLYILLHYFFKFLYKNRFFLYKFIAKRFHSAGRNFNIESEATFIFFEANNHIARQKKKISCKCSRLFTQNFRHFFKICKFVFYNQFFKSFHICLHQFFEISLKIANNSPIFVCAIINFFAPQIYIFCQKRECSCTFSIVHNFPFTRCS